MKYRVGIVADHAAFEMKQLLKEHLKQFVEQVIDFGTDSTASVDYPDYARKLTNAITTKEVDMGFALCGTGNGMAMVLNRHQYIRAGLCWIPDIASLTRAHNDANVCVLPARFISQQVANLIAESFLTTPFEGGRHQQRVNKIELNHV